MATIVYSSEDIGSAYQASLNAALRQVYAESGIVPITRSPYGGLRTYTQQQQINPGQFTSDHVKGRAHDLWNWQHIASKIGLARLHAIFARWGWKHIQVNGVPFPAGVEEWHHACHLTGFALLAMSVKVIVTPKPKTKWRGQMRLVLNPNPRPKPHPKNEYWVVGNGKPYLFIGTAPSREQAEATAFVQNIAAGSTLTPSKTQWANGYMRQFGA